MIEAACGLALSELCFSQVHKKDLTLLASMPCPLGHPFHTVPVYDAKGVHSLAALSSRAQILTGEM